MVKGLLKRIRFNMGILEVNCHEKRAIKVIKEVVKMRYLKE